MIFEIIQPDLRVVVHSTAAEATPSATSKLIKKLLVEGWAPHTRLVLQAKQEDLNFLSEEEVGCLTY